MPHAHITSRQIYLRVPTRRKNAVKKKHHAFVALSVPLTPPLPRRSRSAALRLPILFQHPLRTPDESQLRLPCVSLRIPSFPLHLVLEGSFRVLMGSVPNNCFNDVGGSGTAGTHRWRWGDVDAFIVRAVHLATTDVDDLVYLHIIGQIQPHRVGANKAHNLIGPKVTMNQLESMGSDISVGDEGVFCIQNNLRTSFYPWIDALTMAIGFRWLSILSINQMVLRYAQNSLQSICKLAALQEAF
jgi:hypothetical protein